MGHLRPSPIPLLDLTRQSRSILEELEAALRRVVARGSFILGPEVRKLEEGFARFCQSRFAVGVASGTDALELALRDVGVGPGDIVATVSWTFLATVDAIFHTGAEPLFVDIDPETYTMDPASLELQLGRLDSRTRRRVKAILPVHLYGHPCDMDAIGRIAHRFRLVVIEDAAQAVGARWRGKPVGGIGTVGCFSFFPSKNLGAFGDGGMVVTHSSMLANRLRRLRVHGRGRNGRQVDFGRNSRLDELQAAILRVKLRFLHRWIARRRILAHAYSDQLSRIDGIRCPIEAPGATHSYCLYVIRAHRRAALQKLLLQRGIASHVYYSIPVHRQPIYGVKYRAIQLPETERAAREALALPLFPELRREELTRVCRAITDFYSSR